MAGRTYWQANLRLVALCLGIWFAVSFGCGVLLVDVLNRVTIGGFQLGFWFAQQGSMVVFLGLVAFYAWRMAKIDRRYDADAPSAAGPSDGPKSEDA